MKQGHAVVDAFAGSLRGSGTGNWRRLTSFTAFLVTLIEAALLQRKYGLFTGGFLSVNYMPTWADGVAFLSVVFLLNAAAVAPVSAVALMLGRAVRLRPWAGRFVAVALGSAPLLIADFLMYQLWAYLGDAFDVHLMYQLTGRHAAEIRAVAAPLVAGPLYAGLVLLAGLVAFTWLIHRVQRGVTTVIDVPRPMAVVRTSLGLAAISAAMVTGVALSSDAMAYGLRRTPVGALSAQMLDRLSDFDRDGYGLLQNPRDTAPFDPAIHPYALEIPGNGVDENGLAGDLPVDRAVYREPPPPTRTWPVRPPVILFVLESFRADVVGASYRGREVTPVMDALAARGVRVDSAWSHNGFTRQSRFHILTGSLTGRRGTSLLDDFKNHGYEVAYFSAQDDTAFGTPDINYDRVDKYYDARQDLDKRYTTYSTPGSLAVPFNVLEDHIYEYLGARRSTDPLFLYVNFHDTHYPYHHAGLKNILGGDPLPAALISPARTGDLWRTYLNAAANVDAAIGRVATAVETRLGTAPAIVVISDHGESLFDGGFLGHGYALNAAQTRVPMIVTGLPMRIPIPFGQAGLRDAINDALGGVDALSVRPVVQYGRDVRVFQYLGPMETPGQIAWLTNVGQFTYDFRTNRVGLWDSTVRAEALYGEPLRGFTDLAHFWESIQLAVARRQADLPKAAQ
jgi:hypothetical protein